jgi:hypothetical protein
MRRLLLILLAVVFVGCSGAKLKTEWKDDRGYSDEDIEAAMSKMPEYKKILISGTVYSSRYNNSNEIQADNRLRSIFCSCIKKLGDKCRQKSDGLTGADKDLWIKANAVDMAFASQESSLSSSASKIMDPTECN